MDRCNLLAAAALFVCGAAAPAPAAPITGALTFQNVTSTRIVQTVAESALNEKEVEYGDFDNDGDLDVVIADAHSDFGQRKNKLYRNMAGVFVEISGSPAIPGFSSPDVARNAFFRDYNLDGWLDIIIVCDANTTDPPDAGRTKLYINQHPGGVFSSFTEEGVARLGASTGGAACGGASLDPDMDGDFDLYVGNYPGPSQDTMYFNGNHLSFPGVPGYFGNVTVPNVPLDGDYTVDVSSADLNGDGTLDLLISNGFSSQNFIYYNNLGGTLGPGNFNAPNSVQALVSAANENAMEPGDFDGDGDPDFYRTNQVSLTQDRVYKNTGNDGLGRAVFSELSNLPASVTTVTSRKATVADFNGDSRPDILVMKESAGTSRPTLLRNVTVNGNIEFIDWTPAPAFPTGSTHMGWHAAAFDTGGDGDLDIFLGGWTNDHLFENVATTPLQEGNLTGGVIPVFFNGAPAAVVGNVGAGGSDVYTVTSLTADAFLSVALRGADDYRLEVLDGSNNVLSTINRGGLGVEEATQYDPAAMPATAKLRVTAISCANPFDLAGDCGAGIDDFLALLGAWGLNPGHPADYDGNGSVDILDFLNLLGAWAPSPYVLEVLARSG